MSEKTDLEALPENIREIILKWRGELSGCSQAPILSTQETERGDVPVCSPVIVPVIIPVVTESLILIKAQEASQANVTTFEAFTQANGKRCGHGHTTEARATVCADRLSRGGETWQIRRKA